MYQGFSTLKDFNSIKVQLKPHEYPFHPSKFFLLGQQVPKLKPHEYPFHPAKFAAFQFHKGTIKAVDEVPCILSPHISIP